MQSGILGMTGSCRITILACTQKNQIHSHTFTVKKPFCIIEFILIPYPPPLIHTAPDNDNYLFEV
jgi:hypothetical protein